MNTPELSFLDALTAHHKKAMNESPSQSQIVAWRNSFTDLQKAILQLQNRVPESSHWSIICEYVLPRERGRRPDVIIIGGNDIFVLEFKAYSIPQQSHLDQVSTYVRDLRNYHELSHHAHIIPVLVLGKYNGGRVNLNDVEVCNPETLVEVIVERRSESSINIDPEKWIEAAYDPLPSLVNAARYVFKHEKFPRIKRADSAGIPQTIEELVSIAQEAKKNSELHLVLLTGVPGSGKTLVGLQFVHEYGQGLGNQESVFLSGNGPLVRVLRDALGNKLFVQDVHGFLMQYGGNSKQNPIEHVWVYDEAQRAWDTKKAQSKRGMEAVSEPLDFLRLGERMSGWAVVIALVGEGQEIYTGEEAGVTQWKTALDMMTKPWIVHCPSMLKEVFETKLARLSNRLDLTISLRTHVAENVTQWVQSILDGDSGKASQLSADIRKQGFSLYISRDLDSCKSYLRERYKDDLEKRYGLLASSKAKNLMDYGVMNDFSSTQRVRDGPWYNSPPDSKDSCCQMRSVMTEFGCQGLELDLPIVCWGDDLVWSEGKWDSRTRMRDALDPYKLRINSYRVLLTRGRDGIIIYVPDSPAMNKTCQFLQACGLSNLELKKGPIPVTAAILQQSDRVLICRRDGGSSSGKWEFPGGKVEYGESPEASLVREIREELGCEIRIGSIFNVASVRYPDGYHYVIIFYKCSLVNGEPRALEHREVKWVNLSELKTYDFLEGDRSTINLLSARASEA